MYISKILTTTVDNTCIDIHTHQRTPGTRTSMLWRGLGSGQHAAVGLHVHVVSSYGARQSGHNAAGRQAEIHLVSMPPRRQYPMWLLACTRW